MYEGNKAILHRWFEEVWNQGREDAIDELLSRDGISVGLGETEKEVHGPPDFKPFVRNMRAMILGLHIAIEDMVAEGDKVMVRWAMEGNHAGEGMGTKPTGHRVRVAGMSLVQLLNGQIYRAWNSWDQLGFLRQVGASSAKPSPSMDRFLTR